MVVLSASKFVISLEDVYPAGKYVVKAVSPVYEYLNGKRTDTIIGYRYTLIDSIRQITRLPKKVSPPDRGGES